MAIRRTRGKSGCRSLQDYFRACAAQSGKEFLLIPAEEANVYLGGHWAVVFPKPVYWHMSRAADQPFAVQDAKYGTVYNVGSAQDMWELVKREHGYVYQTHPRTKGSTGYPDAIKDTDYFRDPRYLGAGWKAMPSDLSLPRLGERAFRTIDDMNNLGLHKRMLGEVDVFQLDTTHELYGHMNVNYVRLPALPSYEHYGELLDAVARGDSFISTGEILIPDARGEGRRGRRGDSRRHGELHVSAAPRRDRMGRWRRDASPDHSAGRYAGVRQSQVPVADRGAGLEVGAAGNLGCGRERGFHQCRVAVMARLRANTRESNASAGTLPSVFPRMQM